MNKLHAYRKIPKKNPLKICQYISGHPQGILFRYGEYINEARKPGLTEHFHTLGTSTKNLSLTNMTPRGPQSSRLCLVPFNGFFSTKATFNYSDPVSSPYLVLLTFLRDCESKTTLSPVQHFHLFLFSLVYQYFICSTFNSYMNSSEYTMNVSQLILIGG